MLIPGIAPGLKVLLASGMAILLVPLSVSAAADKVQQIGGVIIPQAFSQALQDGMSIPLFIHLEGSNGTQDDQRIGSGWITAYCASGKYSWKRTITMPPSVNRPASS